MPINYSIPQGMRLSREQKKRHDKIINEGNVHHKTKVRTGALKDGRLYWINVSHYWTDGSQRRGDKPLRSTHIKVFQLGFEIASDLTTENTLSYSRQSISETNHLSSKYSECHYKMGVRRSIEISEHRVFVITKPIAGGQSNRHWYKSLWQTGKAPIGLTTLQGRKLARQPRIPEGFPTNWCRQRYDSEAKGCWHWCDRANPKRLFTL